MQTGSICNNSAGVQTLIPVRSWLQQSCSFSDPDPCYDHIVDLFGIIGDPIEKGPVENGSLFFHRLLMDLNKQLLEALDHEFLVIWSWV
jgi:hypothetical protein